MSTKLRIAWFTITVFFLPAFSGCASFKPRSIDEVPFRERAQTQTKDLVRVTAAVPSAEESEKLFGVSVYKGGVQPVWLEIENKGKTPCGFYQSVWTLPISVLLRRLS